MSEHVSDWMQRPTSEPSVEPRVPALAHAADKAATTRRAHVWRGLLHWYAAHGRHTLPWRHTDDPYAVLVSEVMLQQTQVDRVLPKYQDFLARFPTLAALASAPTAEVITAWAGLGYNSRAVRLQAIAKQAVERFGGKLPTSLAELLALKGIGRYSAGAVACFGMRLQVAMVDTNIRRVLWRLFQGIEPADWPTDQHTQRAVLELAEWTLPPGEAYDWQQALMDFGATLCTARLPLCERCPLAEACAAYAETGRATLFPSGEALVQLRDGRAATTSTTPENTRVAEQAATYNTAGEPAISPASTRQARTKTRRAARVPFTSTSRYYRGRIVAILRDQSTGTPQPVATLGARIKPDFAPGRDDEWLRSLLVGLARDGLAVVTTNATGEECVSLP